MGAAEEEEEEMSSGDFTEPRNMMILILRHVDVMTISSILFSLIDSLFVDSNGL